MSSHYVPATEPWVPPVRSAAALPPDVKSQLKGLLDRYHVAAEYDTQRQAAAPASEPMQWSCTLKLPALVRPGTTKALLDEHSFQALGRGKHDAEQHAAAAALAYVEAAELKA